MDAERFDDLLRTLASGASRRGVLASLASGLLAALPLTLGGDDAAAKKKHKKKKRKKNRPVICTPACAGNNCGPDGCDGSCGTCTGDESCEDGACSPPSPTCTDGIMNGNETDVDCGGSCPRCARDRSCRSRNDCASAFCQEGTCQPCDGTCANDSRGSCVCFPPATSGSFACLSSVGIAGPFNSCAAADCPASTVCVEIALYDFGCAKLCGAP